jgi:tRNA dimethylallyltransferase
MRHPTLLVGLVMERRALQRRVDERVEAMVAAGARQEVMRAHAAGASATARQALGFEELLAGDVEALKRRSRRYAKRQLTWMRKLAAVHTLDVTGLGAEEVAARIDGLAAGDAPEPSRPARGRRPETGISRSP